MTPRLMGNWGHGDVFGHGQGDEDDVMFDAECWGHADVFGHGRGDEIDVTFDEELEAR